jgi:hypothetical protein
MARAVIVAAAGGESGVDRWWRSGSSHFSPQRLEPAPIELRLDIWQVHQS